MTLIKQQPFNLDGRKELLWVTRNVLRYPKHVLLEDRKTGLIIYGNETDKPMNITTTGFGTRFFKVFILCFFALGMLIGISPIALDILGVESFTIGPTNSLYKIFEFHSPEKRFDFTLYPLPLLVISVIAELVYAIIKTGKPRNDAMTG